MAVNMKAMLFEKVGLPLALADVPIPKPHDGQILIRVKACGVCRTDVHIVDGELSDPKTPLILGHQIVGEVVALGAGDHAFKIGDRVGVPWLGGTCSHCYYCEHDAENLCDDAQYSGYRVDGGFAEYCVANSAFAFKLPGDYDFAHAAPLLCAGLIGYRALRKTKGAEHIGFYGFGASAHILTQICRHQGKKVYAITRPGDNEVQAFARQLGATWAGSNADEPPHIFDAAIIFAPAGELVPLALKYVRKGGVVVCAGIHMSDIPSFPYDDLWGEREIVSVANLTRRDGYEFLKVAEDVHIQTSVKQYRLEDANQAIDDIRAGRLEGAAVLVF